MQPVSEWHLGSQVLERVAMPIAIDLAHLSVETVGKYVGDALIIEVVLDVGIPIFQDGIVTYLIDNEGSHWTRSSR